MTMSDQNDSALGSMQRQLPQPPDNSDLMNRLRNFLPQMQTANQALMETSETTAVPQQLDNELKRDDDDDDSDDETENDSNPLIQEFDPKQGLPRTTTTTATTAEASTDAPTIQLEFTLGNMSQNPLMKLLVDEEEDAEGDDSSVETDLLGETANDSERLLSVSDLLSGSTKACDTNAAERQTTAKDKGQTQKPLITELS